MPQGGDQVRPTGPPPSGVVIVGIPRHHSPPLASPGFFAHGLPLILPQEDVHSWEIPPPATRGSHHSHFVHIFDLAYKMFCMRVPLMAMLSSPNLIFFLMLNLIFFLLLQWDFIYTHIIYTCIIHDML